MSLDETIMYAISMQTIAVSGQTISATHIFHLHITGVHVLPLEVIIHRKTKDATIILSRADIRWEVSVTTCFTTAGRKCSVTRRAVTTTASIQDVTCPNITALSSITRTENVTSTRPSLMTAGHADYFMVSWTVVRVTILKTARSHCSSSVMANATKIRLQLQRQPIVELCYVKLSTMKAITCVISRPEHARRNIFMPTVRITATGQQSTLLSRV